MWKRIQGWQTKPLSRVGKLVLIKTVAQAIPSYGMSCFLLSKTLCQDIERILNKFWWGSKANDNKGIKWHAWEAMSMPKSQGGLGFRNLHGFNISLIGKHCWKLINQPQYLVARLFKARYYPDSHFFKFAKGSGSSFLWSEFILQRRLCIRATDG